MPFERGVARVVGEVDVAVELDVQVGTGLRSAVALRALLVDASEAGEEGPGGQVDFGGGPGAERASACPYFEETVPVGIHPSWKEGVGLSVGWGLFSGSACHCGEERR